MNFLHAWHPQPTLLSLGNLQIHWYGLMLALGAAAGYWLVSWLARQRQIASDHINTLFVWLVLAGLIGGRLYHVLNELPYYLHHPDRIIAIWQGGLAIHGAIIAGGLTLWLYARRHKLSVASLADVLIPGLALGQAIGRWGNYFNQELFGRPSNFPWSIPIDPANRPAAYQSAQYFHPTFLYESLGNLLIVLLLLWVWRRQWPAGSVALVYAICYGALRITTESLRIDRTPVIDGIRLPILFSLAMMTVASLAMIWIFRRRENRH